RRPRRRRGPGVGWGPEAGAPQQVPAPLLPGLTVIPLPFRARGPGRHGLDAALRFPADGPLLPGAVHLSLDVVAAPHVLVGAARSGSVVGAALAEHGLQVEAVTPPSLGSRLGRAAAGDVVVLDDVGRADAAALDLGTLARWVARGRALRVTGGPRPFAGPSGA